MVVCAGCSCCSEWKTSWWLSVAVSYTARLCQLQVINWFNGGTCWLQLLQRVEDLVTISGSQLHSSSVSVTSDKLIQWWYVLVAVAAASWRPPGDCQSDSQHGADSGAACPTLQWDQERPRTETQSHRGWRAATGRPAQSAYINWR